MKAALKLVFATMNCVADRWCSVSISDLERHQLTPPLRAELGIDPPLANTDHRNTNQPRGHRHMISRPPI
jgi:hypothetical protein